MKKVILTTVRHEVWVSYDANTVHQPRWALYASTYTGPSDAHNAVQRAMKSGYRQAKYIATSHYTLEG